MLRTLAGIAVLLLLSGCGKKQQTAIVTYAPMRMELASDPSYEGLKSLAISAESKSDRLASRTLYTEKQQNEVRAALAAEIAQLPSLLGKSANFPVEPRGPFDPPKYQRGWRLIGRCLVWNIESAGDNLDQAIASTVLATRFGFALTGGDVSTADLGLTIAAEAREAILPVLPKLSADQLDKLATGLESALFEKPTLQNTFEHARSQMLSNVDALQAAARDGRLPEWQAHLYRDSRDSIERLADVSQNDEKRAEFFQGMAAEATAEVDELKANCLLPAPKRTHKTGLKGKEPWRPLARHLFGGGEALLAINDSALAKTRLLTVRCRLEAQARRTGIAPESLASFDPRLVQDPYAGSKFVYRPIGRDYALYSVGPNGRDDGGREDDLSGDPFSAAAN